MNRSRIDQSERISRKERIDQSINNSHHQFLMSLEQSNNHDLLHTRSNMKLPESEMYIIESPLDVKPSRRRKVKTSNTDVVISERKRNPDKEAKKKKRTKKPSKDRGEKEQKVVIIPECEDCLDLEELIEQRQSPHGSFATLITRSLDEDDCYLSDITNEDERIERTRKLKKGKREKRRPRSERDLGESFRSQKNTTTSTRSLELSPQLRRPRSSFENNNSGRARRAGNRSKSPRNTELELLSIISDEFGEKQSSSRRLLKSDRPLRRPRSSFEKSLMAQRRAGTRRKRERRTKKTKEHRCS